MEKLTMTVAELAQQMGISMPKAYDLTERADFPVLRLGRRKVIPVQAFRDWLESASKPEATKE